VKPYLEVKVVKVQKPKNKVIKFLGRKYELYVKDGKVSIRRHKHLKNKGNWVNGENLDKIKFPVGCNWHIPLDDDVQYGILMKKNSGIELHHIKQHNYSSIIATGNLKELIKRWDIHILKGKIIIFDDTKLKR